MSVEYGKECYRVADTFPKKETYALSDQLRRAAVSISNNVAEGSVGSSASFQRYLYIAIASTLETVNIMHFAFELKYISGSEKQARYAQAELLIKKLRSFIKSLS